MKRFGKGIHIIFRRTKNNHVLIDEPEVGKRAVVEGLAQRIVRGDVSSNLADVRLIALDMGMLVAGAKYRGEFNKKFKIWCDKAGETKAARSRISGWQVGHGLKLDRWIARSRRLERGVPHRSKCLGQKHA
ncbi:hypothetical protein IEQ34_004707 [Dendrobium chrysotoxum]|uniref:Uncharacterized protein n=1 Tax=Dendrobium chrysotoxum TaxID=161865 RepID=A0AAV7HH82_DENCH|nr:hypothetical protein IEQ34_004707 [Dendrobium chrysotoxum]